MDRGADKDRRDLSERVSIVVPVYNEGENIRTTIAELNAHVRSDAAVSLVYDGEDDTTPAPAREAAEVSRLPVRLLRNAYGRGALNAIRTGMEAAEGEYVVVTMADLCDPPEAIDRLVAAADAEGADVVCASRYMRGGSQVGGPRFKGFLSRLAGFLLFHLAGLPTHDPTNSFKLYRRAFLERERIESTGGFELGIELVVKCRAHGGKVVEAPTSWRDRVAGKSNFRLWRWLPRYLRWFAYGFLHR